MLWIIGPKYLMVPLKTSQSKEIDQQQLPMMSETTLLSTSTVIVVLLNGKVIGHKIEFKIMVIQDLWVCNMSGWLTNQLAKSWLKTASAQWDKHSKWSNFWPMANWLTVYTLAQIFWAFKCKEVSWNSLFTVHHFTWWAVISTICHLWWASLGDCFRDHFLPYRHMWKG